MMIDYGISTLLFVHIFDSLPKHLAFHKVTHSNNDVQKGRENHRKVNKLLELY